MLHLQVSYIKDNTHYTRLESTNGIFKIDVDAAQQIANKLKFSEYPLLKNPYMMVISLWNKT